jgi:polysaccharide export outer membrane protein
MRRFSYIILFIFILFAVVFSQAVEDIEKLNTMVENELSRSHGAGEDTSGATKVSSLETFMDKMDSPSREPSVKKEDRNSGYRSEEGGESFDFSKLPYFGHKIFESARTDFTPEVYGPVDESYPVGLGDEIVISVWGEVELRYTLIVNRQGQIFIPQVGLVSVMGMDVANLRKKLIRVMGRSYASLLNNKAFLDVSLGKLRSIRIYVVGDVKNPGLYTVPALIPVFNILFYAGGFNHTSSLREISLIRKDQLVTKLDFYEFLKKGKKFSDVPLQNDDVILISTAQKQVYIAGAVKKPAIFELLEKEGLLELLYYAGGFRENAYTKQIQIERFIQNRERVLVDVDYDRILRGDENFDIEPGDRILVKILDREMKNYITISGPIYGPHRFEYKTGMRLTDLVALVDSIAGDAYMERVHITRLLPDKKKLLFSVNLESILNKKEQDFNLIPQDHVEIKSKNILFPPDSVHIHGAVNNPGKYLLKRNMTLKDLIFTGGGFRKDALIRKAEISRIDPKQESSNSLATIVYVPIDSNYIKQIHTPDESFLLLPNDNVFIRANSDWELQRNVTIRGEVLFPGVFTIKNKTERITDIIKRCGGLTPTAYLEGATIIRRKDNVGRVGIDFVEIFEDPGSDENIFLQAGDIITIPERLYTVKVAGGVNFPSSVYFQKGKSLDYYISAAGGYSELGDEDNVMIQLANGKTFKSKSFLFWEYLPENITAGSMIVVPVLTEKTDIDWSGAVRDVAAILSSVAVTILIIDRVSQ